MRDRVRDDGIDGRIAALIPRLHRFAWVLTGARTDADDITQATLERALVHKQAFSTGTPLEAWAIRVARNLWLDQLRRKKVRLVAVDPVMVSQIQAVGAPDDGETRMEAGEAMRAIQALPPDQCELAVLVLVEGFTYQEAADALRIPIGTVMSRLSRARRALADLLLGPEREPVMPPEGVEP